MELEISKITIDFCQAYENIIYEDGYTQTDKVLPLLSIVHPLHGHYRVKIEDNPFHYLDSGCFIVPPNTRHTIEHYNDPLLGYIHPQWLFMRVLYNDAIDLTQYIQAPLIAPPDVASSLVKAIHQLLEIEDLPQDVETCIVRHRIASTVLADLFGISDFTLGSTEATAIFPALRMIELRYAEPLSVEMMAQACNMARSSFSKSFHHAIGTSPGDFLIRKRLLKAIPLLQDGKTLEVIAREVGFYDEFHFSRMFKQKYGVSPREYRRNELLTVLPKKKI